MERFDREVCQRLPLADACLRLLDFATQDDFLAEVYQRHRGRSYEDLLTFPVFVRLIGDTLLGRERSARQSFLAAQAQGTLPTCIEAAYGKLRRVPVPLSQGLLREGTARLRMVGAASRDPLPASLAAFDVYIFDGKKIKFVAKRLQALRLLRGQVLGGKLLVVQQMSTGLAVACQADADGEAADNPLVAGAVAQVRQQPAVQPRLWVGDRLFCDRPQITLLSQGGEQFVLRYQQKVHFHRDASQPPRSGQDEHGVAYTEEWGWLGSGRGRPYVRRITLHRADAEPIVLVTSLGDADRYPAADVLALYRRRWGIEKLFQCVTEVFDLRHLIGGTPQATIFQAAFCLLLANVIQTVRGYLAAAQQRTPETISTQLLFDDVVAELVAWHRLLAPVQTQAWLQSAAPRTAAELPAYLSQRLAATWRPRWHKAATSNRPRPPKVTQYLNGGHSSVYRIQRGLHQVRAAPEEGGG